MTRGQMTCDAATFYVADQVDVREGEDGDGHEVFVRSWRHQKPRDCV